MINGKQIAAARSLLGINQKTLSERTGLHINVISKFESGAVTNPASDTLNTLSQFMQLEGIVFTSNGGVDIARTPTYILEGDRWYCELLDDVLHSLREHENKIFYVENAVDHVSPKIVINKLSELKQAGLTMRATIKEGDTFLLDDINNYRYIPSDKFHNWNKVIYADKVALQLNDTQCMVIKNKALADTSRNSLEILWAHLNAPVESTSNVRI